jgi:hypothetical protein
LQNIVDVVVSVSPLAAPRSTFNQLLIVGNSAVIPSFGANSRIREYQQADAMLTDGFTDSSPEYLAALLYFSAKPAPTTLWVGRHNLTTLKTLALNAPGSGYHVGDILTIVHAGASGGTVTVLTVDGSGDITSLSPAITTPGTGYAIAAGCAVTGGYGTSATIDVSAIGESPLQAIQACRAINFEWYVGVVLDAITADHEVIAPWAEAAQPPTVYAFTTQDADVLNNVGGNVCLTLMGESFSRTISQYSTDNPYAIVAVMGYAMGQNTGLANSAFTLKFKGEVGINTEQLAPTQVGYIEGANCNLYLSYGNYYNIFEQGKMANGQFFDEIINIDMLANNVQLTVMDLLYQTPKVPQTDAGVTQIIHACNVACQQAVDIGFLAPGLWTGVDILNLKNGDTLPKGYLVQAPPVASQSSADRQARKSPPIYIAIKEAGAIHSVLLGLYINR